MAVAHAHWPLISLVNDTQHGDAGRLINVNKISSYG